MEVGKPHKNCQLLVDAIILEIFGNSFRKFMVTGCIYYRSRSRIMYVCMMPFSCLLNYSVAQVVMYVAIPRSTDHRIA